MNVELHHLKYLQRLRYRRRKEPNAKQRDRYRAVLLALEDQNTEAIMQTLVRRRNFVQRWIFIIRRQCQMVVSLSSSYNLKKEKRSFSVRNLNLLGETAENA